MSRAREYRARALEALEQAEAAHILYKKNMLLQSARVWLVEAERLDSVEQMKKANTQANKERQLRADMQRKRAKAAAKSASN